MWPSAHKPGLSSGSFLTKVLDFPRVRWTPHHLNEKNVQNPLRPASKSARLRDARLGRRRRLQPPGPGPGAASRRARRGAQEGRREGQQQGAQSATAPGARGAGRLPRPMFRVLVDVGRGANVYFLAVKWLDFNH